jgi:hypothetical protein
MGLFGFISGPEKRDPLSQKELIIDNPLANKFDDSKPLPTILKTNENPVSHRITRLVGVTLINGDGSRRQDIIPKCGPFEPLELIQETSANNKRNAIKVTRHTGEQIGYLTAKDGRMVWNLSYYDYNFRALAARITGGGGTGKAIGMDLILITAVPGISEEEIRDYINKLLIDGSGS